MPESMPGDPTFATRESRTGTWTHQLAVLSSMVVPGAGHILMGQRRKGSILLCIFLLLLVCFWPARLPRYYAGLVLLYLAWFALYLYAACSALATRSARRLRSGLWLIGVVPLAFALSLLWANLVTRASGFRLMEIPSTSMERTLLAGDHIVVDTRCFDHEPPAYQDVIIFRQKNTFYVKRVIGVGGDVIGGNNGEILINGSIRDESYIQHVGHPPLWMSNFGPVIVPAGEYFVMGDNRDVSLDSRSADFGLIPGSTIIGAPLYVFRTDRQGRSIH